jgi:medium-chain acyl-[acyl-carrier-protein] hydrolase
VSSIWIIRPRPRPRAAVRLFCLPCAGGGASTFHAWAGGFHGHVEVCAVQLPGRENRLKESPARSLGDLVPALAAAIEPELRRPYALFGHSMGALLAFELLRRLEQSGARSPMHFFAASAPAPHLRPRRPPLHRLGDAALIASLRGFDGLPGWVIEDPELLALFLPTLRADLEVCDTYRYGAARPLACPITALGGASDRSVPRFELAAWAAHTSAQFTLRLFEGSHFFLAERRDAVLDAISTALAPAIAGL